MCYCRIALNCIFLLYFKIEGAFLPSKITHSLYAYSNIHFHQPLHGLYL